MENNYRISHTAFPDGDVVAYSDGMSRPHVLGMGDVMKKALFNAIVKTERKKTAKIIKLEPVQSSVTLYALK